jgi:uncharacterized protein YbcC (UPF0753/DUF2309 family)
VADDRGFESALHRDGSRLGREASLTAVLASVNGWAAWCAQRRWQARLAGSDDDAIVELLAIRLAWSGCSRPTSTT